MNIIRTLIAVTLLLFGVQSAPASIAETRSWEFSVLLDGSPIGYHNFELVEAGERHEVISEASFDVRFLFFNAFRYRHSNRESWRGDCLSSIESKTRQNDKRFSVRGSQVDNQFTIESDGQAMALDNCVMTFAYWDSDFLQQPRLLNPQSGEYLPVNVEPLGKQAVVVRGNTVQASAYRVTAKATELVVWYSDDDEWLGLESVAKGGRIIRYELT